MHNIGMVFVTCLTWQKTADFEVGWRNIKFTSVVIIMNKEMILYSYLYSYCVGPAAGRRTHIHTHTHTHTLSPLYRRFNTTLIIDLNISLATVYFILVLFVNRLQKLLEMPEHVRPQDVVTEGETLSLKFVVLLFF